MATTSTDATGYKSKTTTEASRKVGAVFCGGLCRDMVTVCKKFPIDGETVLGTSFFTGFGGKSGNQAIMAAKLASGRFPVHFVGVLGDDENGRAYRQNFLDCGVDATYVTSASDPGTPSGVASIWVDEARGENRILVVPGSNAELRAPEVARAEAAIAGSKILVVALESDLGGVAMALKLARERGTTTLLNAAPASMEAASNPDLFCNTDILCVNESEAEILTGLEPGSLRTGDDVTAVVRDLLSRCPSVIVTLGSKGAAYSYRGGPVKTVAAEKASKVVDTTGAGDAFVGALAYYLAEAEVGPEMGQDIGEAIRRACAIATKSVEREGTQASYPSRDQLPESLFD